MDSLFDTFVDFGDYFDSDTDFSSEDVFGPEMPETEKPVPEIVGQEPIPEVKYEEPPQAKEIEDMVQKAEPPTQELLGRVEQAARKEGESGIKKFFDELSEKDRNSLLRYSLGAMGMGAKEALRAIQQRREQEFQKEQTDRAYQERRAESDRFYQERRAEEERAAEARRVAGTPGAYQFNVAPRGIIGGGMGG